jgi:hypothetical protein
MRDVELYRMHEAIQSLKRRVEALEKASAPEPRVAPVAAWTAKSAPPRYDEVYAEGAAMLNADGATPAEGAKREECRHRWASINDGPKFCQLCDVRATPPEEETK